MASAPRSSAIGSGAPERWALYLLAALCGAALLLTGLLVTRETTIAPDAYLIAGVCWLIGSLMSVMWDRWRGISSGAGWFNPLMLFFAVVAATYTVHAIDGVPSKPNGFNPNQPDDLPGIYTNFTPYYLVLLAGTVLAASWYGRRRDRETETGVAVLVVFTSLAFEHMLRSAGNELEPAVGSLSAALLWAPLLVLLAMWRSDSSLVDRNWHWTPLGAPLLALVVAGTISTLFSVYFHASSLMLLRVAGFATLLLLVANTVTETRQVRLYWAALVLPLALAAIVVVAKLWELGVNLGFDFVMSLRYQISGVAGTNPAGLSLGIAILLVIGAIVVQKDRRRRAGLALLLVPLVPAFFATHSPSGLVALAVAIPGLVFFRYGRETWQAGPTRIALVAGGAAAVVLVLGLVAFLPNPYTGKVSGDVTDPTTGRSVRGLVWRLGLESFREDPLTGVGLQNYYARTKHVGDFPSVDATRVGERRQLLDGTGEPWKPYVTSHPHNAYLAILETMGLAGLFAVAWLAVALAFVAWRLFFVASGSFWWWAATTSLAGGGMALAWGVVAQGEDVTIIALPFWPLLGLALGSLAVLDPEFAATRSSTWARLRQPVARWSARPVLRPALAGLTALAFLVMVARPVAAEVLVQKSDEAADNDNPRSLQMMRWAERLSPLSADYHRRLGDAYIRNARFADAIDEQKSVLDVRSDYAPDAARLGWLYWFGRDLERASAAFQRAFDHDRWDTTRANVHMSLGLIEAARGNYEGALNAFAYGFSVSPSMLLDDAWVTNIASAPPSVYLDPTYLQPVEDGLSTGLQRSLVRRLELPGPRAAVASPTAGPDYSLATVLERMRRQYDGLAVQDPGRAESVLAVRGLVALKAGLLDQAISSYEELVGLNPDDEKAHYGLGLAYAASGDERAKESFQRVLELADGQSTYVLREPFSHLYLGRLALEEQPPDLPAALRELRAAKETYRWGYMPGLYPYLALAEALSGNGDNAQDQLDRELFLLDVDTDTNSASLTPPETAGTNRPETAGAVER